MTHSSLRTARNHVSPLCAALAAPTPQSIYECLPGLAEAAECLARAQTEIAQSRGGGHVFEIYALKRELGKARKLIEQGAVFYQGWARMLGAAASGYTASGEAGPVRAAGQISIRG